MNENINLVEILKDCPKGTKLYSPIFGEVKFIEINNNKSNPIIVLDKRGSTRCFSATGKFYFMYDEAECLLFPSKNQVDWNEFTPSKFDPKTLQPFDKVLVRDTENAAFVLYEDFVSCMRDIDDIPQVMSGLLLYHVIPFNDETKHLFGTSDIAPKYYRYWED